MKRNYVKPELDIIFSCLEHSLLAGSGITGTGGINDGGEPDDGSHDPDANTINLWDEMDDSL